MGRKESPLDPSAGPVERFAFELRALRQSAGGLTYRAMARRTEYSTATLAQAASGDRLPSLAVALAYVTACGGDSAAWERRWQQVTDQLLCRPPEEDDDAVPPYPGLRRFQPEDRERFFGRDRLTEDLVGLIRERRFAAVVGASGSGKSSLLRAGFIPALQDAGPAAGRPAALRILTPGPHPARAHAQALTAARGRGDTVVVVDQFEETFTLCHDPAERAEFIELLLSARDPERRLRVVVAVRADFFGHCAGHRALADALRDATLLVAPMTPAELREAIVKPAAAEGLIVERALTARLVEEVADEPGGLPLLSHVLLETWRRRRARTLTMAAYEATGGIHGAVAQTAEDLYDRLPPEQALAARRILLRLVTPGEGAPDTRRPADRAELQADGPGEAAAVLERLARARLITLDDEVVNLAHEALITAWPRLRDWIDEDRHRLRLHRQLTEAALAWERLGRDHGALYRGVRLAEADEAFGPPERAADLTPAEHAFLAESRAGLRKERRRLRQVLAAVSVALCLALVATGVAFWQRNTAVGEEHKAQAARQLAQSRQLAAQSAALLDQNPDLASLLAVRAYRTHPTAEATDSLYAAAALPAQKRLTGHKGEVLSVAFAPDGRTLATGGEDGTVLLRDAATGRVRDTLTGHVGQVTSVAFSPDGRTLAVADAREVRLSHAGTGRVRRTLTPRAGMMMTMAFSPDGRTLATGRSDGLVRLWDTGTGRLRATLTGHADTVVSVAFSPDGRTLATGAIDRKVRLWDTGTGRLRTSFTGDSEGVLAVAFSPDGRTLATGGGERSVRLWNAGTGELRDTLPELGPARSLAFSPDGRALATGGGGSHVRLWDLDAGLARDAFSLGYDGPVLSVAFSPDGRTLATGGDEGLLRLWDVATGRARDILARQPGGVLSVAFAPDGRTLASGNGRDDTVKLWDAASGEQRRSLTLGSREDMPSLAFSPDGRTLATGRFDGVIHLWNPDTGWIRRGLHGHTDFVRSVAFSPDGRTLATGSNDKTARLWDVSSGRALRVLRGHDKGVFSVAFSPDGRTLATSGVDRTVRLWDAKTGRALRTLKGHTAGVTSTAFSRDGRTLASGGMDGSVRLWDVASGRTRKVLDGHTESVFSVVFSPDGRTLVSGGETVRLWDAESGEPRGSLRGHTDGVWGVAFSPDGRTLASGGDDETVRLWNLDLRRPSEAIGKICGTVDRDLTRRERATYLPDQPSGRVCPA
ncbi:hypothetical protein ACH4S9_36895 [Streptomyces sp. NPDC021225]|uniref:nSTAND1 domain-containing NTPase n=1 Tax=Streptomyces sp. NPDC021225 TaxID=3365121 RepID=UPI0037942882